MSLLSDFTYLIIIPKREGSKREGSKREGSKREEWFWGQNDFSGPSENVFYPLKITFSPIVNLLNVLCFLLNVLDFSLILTLKIERKLERANRSNFVQARTPFYPLRAWKVRGLRPFL